MAGSMKFFTCTNFDGHYPVGTAAVIIAKDFDEARELLRIELEGHSLDSSQSLELEEIEVKPQAIILCDGNY